MGDKCGYIDSSGTVVIPLQFDQADEFTPGGLAKAALSDQWVYIDRHGGRVGTSLADPKSRRSLLISWLTDMKAGRSTVGYWTEVDNATTLYSVKSWEILSVETTGDPSSAIVQVESSTKGGFPIRKNWAITLKNDDIIMGWKIVRMTEQ